VRLNKLATTKRVEIMINDRYIHGMTGQKNASKEVTKSSRLEIRCTPQEKAAWVHAAKGKKLAEWVTEALNEAADK